MPEINLADIILILLIAAAAVLAVRKMIRDRKKGGCSCGCAGCTSGTCAGRQPTGTVPVGRTKEAE